MDKKVIFFDGQCLTCHLAVKFIFKRDKDKELYYSPIGSSLYQKLIPEQFHHIDSVIYFDKKPVFTFQAVQSISAIIYKRNSALNTLIQKTPIFIGNLVYSTIAKLRKIQIKLSPKDVCTLAQTPDEKELQKRIIF